MELKDYIKAALVDICEAIYEAKKVVGNKVAIAPASIDGRLVDKEHLIAFEISVSASDSFAGKGKGKIEVIALGAGVEANVQEKKEHVNKISFSVPVYYSAQFIEKT